MRRLRVRHVIELAAGLNGFQPDEVVFGLCDYSNAVRGAAVLVAAVHCRAPESVHADAFELYAVTYKILLNVLRTGTWSEDFERIAEELNQAVIALKAGWRREDAMRQWRAAQRPEAVIVHGTWHPRSTPENVAMTRRYTRERKSAWVEPVAPVGVGADGP